MRTTIENTDRITMVNGVPVRIWEGKTETGIPMIALIALIAANKDSDCSQFEEELSEVSTARVDMSPLPPGIIVWKEE